VAQDPSAPIDPDDIIKQSFTTVRRGLDPLEVQRFLLDLANQVRSSRDRERDLSAKLAEAERRATPIDQLDPSRLTALLGEETARVLDAARGAAAEIRAKAEENVARLLREARDEAQRMRDEAETVLLRRTEEAEVEVARIKAAAEGVREQAQSDAEEIRQAAVALRDRAEVEAAALREQVEAETTAMREQAEADAAATRDQADADAAARIEEGRQEGREMVAEAQRVRQRMLDDLSRRRKLLRQQIEQLQAGRDRLLAAYDVVRETLAVATEELQVALPEAKLAAETASLRAADEDHGAFVAEVDDSSGAEASGGDDAGGPGVEAAVVPAGVEGTRDEGAEAAELEAEDLQGEDLGSEDLGSEDLEGEPEPVDGADSADAEVAAVLDDGGEPAAGLEAESEGPGTGADAAAAEADLVDDDDPSDVEVAGADEPSAAVAAEGVEPDELDEVVEEGSHDADDRTEPAGDEADEDAEAQDAASETEGAAELTDVTDSEDDDEPAEVRAPDPEEGRRSTAVNVVRPESADRTAAIFRRLRDDGDPDDQDERVAGAATMIDTSRAAEVDDDEVDLLEPEVAHPLLAARDAATAGLVRALARRVKRDLSDEQNEMLDAIRRQKGTPRADSVMPAAAAHAERYRTAVLPILADAAEAGGELVGDRPAADDLTDVTGLATDLADELVSPLRDRLERSFAEADGDRDELAERVRACYREWKAQRVDGPATRSVLAAANEGLVDRLGPDELVRWIVAGVPSPDCEDNGLSEPQPAGEPFPTGHRAPPLHDTCRCIVVPADGD
jgi:cell division septum initiation protein DivIVA